MVNYGFYITARNSSTKERILRVNIHEWHELLFTLCPNFAGHTRTFKFNREDVLSEDEIKFLENISYDEGAVSVSEGYEEVKAPNFEDARKWRNIFKKIERKYFEIEKNDILNEMPHSGNEETKMAKIIRTIRSSQVHFDQINQTLNVAEENNLEIAFTIADY